MATREGCHTKPCSGRYSQPAFETLVTRLAFASRHTRPHLGPSQSVMTTPSPMSSCRPPCLVVGRGPGCAERIVRPGPRRPSATLGASSASHAHTAGSPASTPRALRGSFALASFTGAVEDGASHSLIPEMRSIVIARLGIDRSFRARGRGEQLLFDAPKTRRRIGNLGGPMGQRDCLEASRICRCQSSIVLGLQLAPPYCVGLHVRGQCGGGRLGGWRTIAGQRLIYGETKQQREDNGR